MISLSHARPSPIWQGNASEGDLSDGTARATATKSSQGIIEKAVNERKPPPPSPVSRGCFPSRIESNHQTLMGFRGRSPIETRLLAFFLSFFLSFFISLHSPFSEKLAQKCSFRGERTTTGWNKLCLHSSSPPPLALEWRPSSPIITA